MGLRARRNQSSRTWKAVGPQELVQTVWVGMDRHWHSREPYGLGVVAQQQRVGRAQFWGQIELSGSRSCPCVCRGI